MQTNEILEAIFCRRIEKQSCNIKKVTHTLLHTSCKTPSLSSISASLATPPPIVRTTTGGLVYAEKHDSFSAALIWAGGRERKGEKKRKRKMFIYPRERKLRVRATRCVDGAMGFLYFIASESMRSWRLQRPVEHQHHHFAMLFSALHHRHGMMRMIVNKWQ